jgi:acetylornithine deacetylase/succinyl-diaminopimelate desuccinylase-like protein
MTLATIMASEAYRRGLASLDAGHERMVGDIVTLTEIPSPPFGEAERGRAYRAMLAVHGLEEVETDAVGNVMGLRRGTGNGHLLVVAAHLDTVFPAGTDVTVRREGNRLYAPGVGDDTRSLAVLLAFIRALDAAGARTRSDILFVGDVGEEGLGDLRGMRHLFTEGRYAGQIANFITVDSPEMENIVVTGIGSKRYRVRFRGPGGHSFSAFGIVNPAYAMADSMRALASLAVARGTRTTHAVSGVGGGTSINAIPDLVWMDVDLRSSDADELARIEASFRASVDASVAAENAARRVSAGRITAEWESLGDRPAGRTDTGTALVRFAKAAIAAHGFTPEESASSTDANVAMSLGIPAIKIGSGGAGGRAHSLEEWIDVTKEPSLRGIAAGFATILAVAGLEG